MATIADRRGFVQLLLSNRSDLSVIQVGDPAPFNTRPKIDAWMGESYIEMGNSWEFEDLEIGPLISVTPNDGVTQSTPFPADCRAVKQISIDFDGTGKYIPLRGPFNINVIRRTAGLSPGKPSRWARFGYNLWFDRVPDQAYNYQLVYWQKPVLVVNVADATSDIENTPLAMPDDWLTILDNLTALRGWQYLEDTLKIQETKQLLYGDPLHPERPGMIKAKMMARDPEKEVAEYAISPTRYPYTHTR